MPFLTEERRMIQEQAREFTLNEVLPVANKLDPEKGDIPMELREKMAELGYFGILIPEEYGGLGLDCSEYCLVTEELSRGWMSVASIIARGNLLIGLVVNEYLEDFHRGDFLIRNLLGADPQSGAIAVGALPRPGQTIQFQRRDANAANEDMSELLSTAAKKLESRTVYGACLCSCNGRGQGLFGQPNHDASMVQERLGPFGMAGFFCSGEIGPIGDRNFLHGFTASLALFVKK